MSNIDDTEQTARAMMTAHALPAILIGGPPHAGKSVLTYNLTQALRRLDIPHYVFRAHPDMEGDWLLQDNQDNVRSIHVSFEHYRAQWSDEFREFVCQDLARRRHLPLLVDLGGRPKEEDQCIFRACTHSILLLKDDEKKLSQDWRDFARRNDLFPLAEITSELEGTSTVTSWKPVIKGTITGLVRGTQYIPGPVFEAIVERVSGLFSSYSQAELEKRHLEDAQLEDAQIEFVVHLDQQLHALAPDTDEWTYDLLEPLLAELPPQTPMAVYGRGPNWLYGALALHAGTKLFYQFDVRLGWVPVPSLQISPSGQLPQSLLHIVDPPYTDDEQYVIEMHPRHNYIDYTDAGKLAFPEPPPDRGVIVSGKLPLWLFTALARLYKQLDVPWIALTDAHNNTAIVIHSRVEKYLVGDPLRMPV